jgi:PAS domain S-box-containing protein
MIISAKRLFLGLGILASVLAVSGLLAFRHTRRLRDDALWVARTHEALEALGRVQETITEAETGQRGYLLTGDPGYLQPYLAAVAQVHQDYQRVQDLAWPEPAQRSLVEALGRLLDAKLEELKETIALQARDPEAARRVVRTHLGRNLMTGIRTQLADLTARERELLRVRQGQSRHSYRVALWSGAVFALLGLALAVAFLDELRRHLRDRAAQERALEEQRQWLQVTLSSIGDAVIATGPGGAVTFMNPTAERLTGWSAAEALGRPLAAVFRILNEGTREPIADPVAKVLREGRVVGLANHTALVSRDGRECPIEDSAAPILDPAGKVAGVVLVFHDAGESRRTETALRRSEQRFRTLTELSPDAIWVNRDDRLDLVNHQALQLMGAERGDQLVGRNPYGIFHPSCHDRVRSRLAAVRAGRAVHHSEEILVRLDGTRRIVDVSSAPFEDAQGPAVQVVLRDITERKEAEQELGEASRRKDEFLGTLAHELRNPLAPIRTGAYILGAKPAPDPETKQIYDMIARQAAHMARLVDDLLQVSRIERGKLELRKERVDLGRLLDHALEACQPALEARRHHLAVTLPDPAPALEADPIRLEQMVANLVHNACKCTPPGGEIQVWAAREGGDVVLGVRDNGVGMEPGEIAHVFDLFYQGGGAKAQAEGGLGIGLTLVHHLAQLHGGTVSAHSAGPGRGSEFVLRLPGLEPAPVPDPAAQAPVPAPEGRTRHVLIIDDDPNVRTTSGMLLEAMNYRVSLAATGTRGIEQARTLRPDIALIDLGMPDLDGCEVAARIRAELGRSIYLVAVTGFSRDSDLARTRAAGFDRHLVKSGDPGELLDLLGSIP